MTSITMAQAVWPRRIERPGAAWSRDLILVFGFSLLTALTAQVAIPLPWTPVPITGQTFGVLLTGAVLGSRLGAASLLLYLVEGSAGLPFFAGGAAGAARLIGPTGGYLLAYPLAAGLVGWLAERGWDRRAGTTLAAMGLGSLLIFALGAAQLSHFLPGGWKPALKLGVLPFLPGDALKALLAAALLPAAWQRLGGRRG